VRGNKVKASTVKAIKAYITAVIKDLATIGLGMLGCVFLGVMVDKLYPTLRLKLYIDSKLVELGVGIIVMSIAILFYVFVILRDYKPHICRLEEKNN
jgi:hypothetical protein